ncbi:hypothetical protein BJX99DRAFT_259846 [Aspergillus californicus]
MVYKERTTCFDTRLLRGLVGTTVTTYDLVSDGASPQSTLSAVSRTGVITKKLTERAAHMTDYDVKMGRGAAKTVGKFLCHLAGDPNQIAFMRIYQQNPITGTEDADHDTLARQAVAPGKVHKETTTSFLAATLDTLCGKKSQGSLYQRAFFWGLDITAREDIRAKFRDAYDYLVAGYHQTNPGSRKSSLISPRAAYASRGSEWDGQLLMKLDGQRLVTEKDWYLHPEKWQW